MCHDASQVVKLMAYHKQMRAALPEMDAALQRVRKALESTKVAADRVTAMRSELKEIEHDFDFLRGQ